MGLYCSKKRVRKEDNATAVDIEMGDGDSIVPSTFGFEEETTQQPVERQSLLGGPFGGKFP